MTGGYRYLLSSSDCRNVTKKMSPFTVGYLVPFTIIIQVITDSIYSHPVSCALTFTKHYYFSRIILYTTYELTNRLQFLFSYFFTVQMKVSKNWPVQTPVSLLIYLAFTSLWMRWIVYKHNFLSCDTEMNSDYARATFSFCA